MRTRKEEATAVTMAPKNELHNKSYQNCALGSREKLQIGTLLLALQTPLGQRQQKRCWVLFESKLREYLDLKVCRGTV